MVEIIYWLNLYCQNKYYEGRHFESFVSNLRDIVGKHVMGDKKFILKSFSNKRDLQENIEYLRRKISEIVSLGF